MEEFTIVIKKDKQVRDKINDMLDRYMKKPYNYPSKIGYDCLIQNVILKELMKVMGATITDLDIELKLKIRRMKNSENKKNSQISKRVR